MKKSDEVFTIECTIRNIFYKDVIRSIDVTMANNLLDKWKLLTGYVEDAASPVQVSIIDNEPKWQTESNE
jgi:hypothetical protein